MAKVYFVWLIGLCIFLMPSASNLDSAKAGRSWWFRASLGIRSAKHKVNLSTYTWPTETKPAFAIVQGQRPKARKYDKKITYDSTSL
jgi:hypothetical protein